MLARSGLSTLPTMLPTSWKSSRRAFHAHNCALVMGTGFSGHRCTPHCPRRSPRHGSKEAIVARRVRTRTIPLEVRLTFEPSRVSPACIVQAYERVVPITRRTTPQALPPRLDEDALQTQRVGRRP